MARPWRDVISVRGWDQAVIKNRIGTGGYADAGTKLRSVVSDKYSSPAAFLEHIGRKLRAYHGINKISLETIDARRDALKELSELAAQYLKAFNVNMDAAAQRVAGKSLYSGRFSGGDPLQESADRNVLSLARRALRKREYLKQLKAFYTKGGGGFATRQSAALFDYLAQPQQKADGLIGLTPGVRMEQLDFVHRGDFETDDPGSISCGAAFQEWAQDMMHEHVPFFLWLEMHPVCLEDSKDRLETGSVGYGRADRHGGGSGIDKLCLILSGPPLMMVDLGGGNGAPRTASTIDYKAEGAKDPRNGMQVEGITRNFLGDGVAAYVWTKECELFIAQHLAQQFHHSSFISGDMVRCAGMIAIEQGRVVSLSNNSGHYKPRKEHLLNFVQALQAVGALDGNCVVRVQVGGGHAWLGTVRKFHADYSRLEMLAAELSGLPTNARAVQDNAARNAALRVKGMQSV